MRGWSCRNRWPALGSQERDFAVTEGPTVKIGHILALGDPKLGLPKEED